MEPASRVTPPSALACRTGALTHADRCTRAMNHALVLGSIFAVHVLAMAGPGPNFLIVTQTAISRTRRAGAWSIAALVGLSVMFAHEAWLRSAVALPHHGWPVTLTGTVLFVVVPLPSWPELLDPQQGAMPPVVTPQLWPLPVLTAAVVVGTVIAAVPLFPSLVAVAVAWPTWIPVADPAELTGPHLARASLDIRAQLAALVYPGFLSRTQWNKLAHLPRYLSAMRLRFEKYGSNAERDERHMAAVERLWKMHQERQEKHRKAGVHDPQLAEFRWLIEELRVSLFAQELKTPMPISVKRLEKVWQGVRS